MSDETLTRDERYLVSLAAAVAAGCVPCAAYYSAKARAAGLAPADLEAAIATAASTRREATDAVERAVSGREALAAGSRPDLPAGRLSLLESLAAACAVNSEAILDRLLASPAIEIAADDLRGCAQIARDVRGMAIRIVDDRVERVCGALPPAEKTGCSCG